MENLETTNLWYCLYRTDKANEFLGLMKTLQYPITGEYLEFQGEEEIIHATYCIDRVIRYYEASQDENVKVFATKL